MVSVASREDPHSRERSAAIVSSRAEIELGTTLHSAMDRKLSEGESDHGGNNVTEDTRARAPRTQRESGGMQTHKRREREGENETDAHAKQAPSLRVRADWSDASKGSGECPALAFTAPRRSAGAAPAPAPAPLEGEREQPSVVLGESPQATRKPTSS